MEELEDQKMLALKKVYAEIILNTVKEAAARVMVSERKARCLQQELCSVKDEALRMLLRLKNRIDSKMHEAEIALLCQRRKKEELEARLHEAEDVITCLRIQLKKEQCQLKNERKDKMHKTTFPSQSTLDPDSYSPSSELQTLSSDLRNTKMEKIAHVTYDSRPKSIEQSTVSQVDVIHAHDSDSTSTEVRTEQRSYRTRRFQRIRALETDTRKSLHGAVLKRSVKLRTLKRMSQFRNVTQNSCLPQEHKINSYQDVTGKSNAGKLKGNMKRGNLNGHRPNRTWSQQDQSNSVTKPDQLIHNFRKSFVLSPWDEVTNSSPCQVDKKMFLKSSRQSKRKREANDISDENISSDKNNGKRRLIEKLKFDPKFQRFDMIRELKTTRESRQLSQVARQERYTFSFAILEM